MATLDEILEAWDVDSEFDDNHIDIESVKVPKLHSKYLVHLVDAKRVLIARKSEYSTLRKLKFRYYRGEMTKEELKTYNWEQWQGTKPLKNEMDQFLSGDENLLDLQMRIESIELKIQAIESILTQIKNRDWQLKNVIEWKKFLAGA